MLTIGTTVVGVADMGRALSFWCQALGYIERDGDAEGTDFVVLVPREGQGARLALDVSESAVQDRPRVHLDLYTSSASEQKSEVTRLLALGATLVDWDLYPDDPDFIVLADTEGNRFCVIDRSSGEA